ncbi:PREDICTED: uncharacterized protein LOC109165608 [Ipomoea nil]|uniref:uncharacterized protein LOC109165608 n=1 Tax=Ipomoea nil TaxID=35883 RepID=UPI000900CC8A|nr:PREDICTED: uncharacterized protein LOC109165608 [Ipomoea nil]
MAIEAAPTPTRRRWRVTTKPSQGEGHVMRTHRKTRGTDEQFLALTATTDLMCYSQAVGHPQCVSQVDYATAGCPQYLPERALIRDSLHETASWIRGSRTSGSRFLASKTDVSFHYTIGDSRVFLLVYVDDIIMMGTDLVFIDSLLRRLSSTFKIRDLGKPTFFLGIETLSDGDGFVLSQRRYMADILSRAGMTVCKALATPASVTKPATPSPDPFDNPTQYRRIVGALQYLTITRPDLSFAVNWLCQFMHSPTQDHGGLLKRVLRYFKGTLDYRLRLAPSLTSALHAFSDSDWVGCPVDRKSTSGYAVFLGSNLVSWLSCKQCTVARSSTEAEYKGLVDVSAEVTWVVSLLWELGLHSGSPATLWCDNLGATYLAANPVFHARTKHVEIDFHFVYDKVAAGDFIVNFISTKDQLSDIFTKPLPAPRFQAL